MRAVSSTPLIRNSHIIEGQSISARWRSLAHSYLPPASPLPGFLAERLAEDLEETGSFSSAEHSLKFVQDLALDGIGSVIRLCKQLETAFKVEVTSSDMFLLFETPGVAYDQAKMSNEFKSDGVPALKKDEFGRRYRIAGTTEVGIGKKISGRAGEDQRTEILLKTNVVLNMDVGGSGK